MNPDDCVAVYVRDVLVLNDIYQYGLGLLPTVVTNAVTPFGVHVLSLRRLVSFELELICKFSYGRVLNPVKLCFASLKEFNGLDCEVVNAVVVALDFNNPVNMAYPPASLSFQTEGSGSALRRGG
ncbi:hypothetical protein EVAR_63960_1 [Eumeta japonica]|uniref:Uncharacterized protein n=1 Tax=Eumeta variegata TaxID=151549 RepID=A0A4C1ZZA0_EUMVA|nr:hypothetical protein EVAR_63960_1 [Eumeta japonica]